MNESATRVRKATTFPLSRRISILVTSATRRSRSDPAAVSTARRPASRSLRQHLRSYKRLQTWSSLPCIPPVIAVVQDRSSIAQKSKLAAITAEIHSQTMKPTPAPSRSIPDSSRPCDLDVAVPIGFTRSSTTYRLMGRSGRSLLRCDDRLAIRLYCYSQV